MSKLQIASLSFVLAFASIGNLQAQTKTFLEAKGSEKYQTNYDFDRWNFSVSKNRYEIRKDGKAKRTNIKNHATYFRIKLDKEESIERAVYFAQYKNDLLLICEVGMADAAAGFIARLDGKTLKTKWKRHISAFNIAHGLIENNSAYLAAFGFAAKINLAKGNFLWKHENFYRKYKESGAFNIFETINIKGNIVTFTENQDNYNRPPNIIKFNKISGKVIEVKVN